MSVGLYARQLLIRIANFQGSCRKHLRSYEVGRTHHVRRIFPRHHKSVAVNHAGGAGLRVYKHIVVGEVGVSETGGMQTFHGTRYLYQHVEMRQPSPLKLMLHETVAQLR